MLNFVYWPISAILWFWHKATGLIFSPDTGISWVIAIMLLVVTIRVLLFRPMLNQQRSAIKMQQMQPAMAAIREKYKNDQQAQAMEMRKLQKEMGVNPLGGCLPVLVQMPVFIGLFHVLRSFNRTGTSGNALGLSPAENWVTPNYIFDASEVQSFLTARIFSAPISASVSMGEDQFAAFTQPGTPADFTRTDIMIVAIPLILISALATHFNARMSVNRTRARQESGLQARQEGMMGQQMDMMNKMMLWFFPIMILATGFLWHIGLLVYMVTNNIWTYFQQRYIFAKLDKEEAEELAAKAAAKRETQEKLAPKPGVKPVNPKKGGKKASHIPSSSAQNTAAGNDTPRATGADDKASSVGSTATDGGAAPESLWSKLDAEKRANSTKPQPGQRPQNSKRNKKRKR